MGDNFYAKEYGDYFAQLEKEVEIKNKIEEENKKNKNVSAEDFKSQRRKKQLLKVRLIRFGAVVLSVVFVVCIVSLISNIVKNANKSTPTTKKAVSKVEQTLYPKITKSTDTMSKVCNLYEEKADEKGIKSESGIFVSLADNTAISAKNADKKLSPASLTKIMTLLVAVENITDYEQKFTMSYTIINPLYGEASMAGYSSSEVLSVNDLLYGTILPSGGEAAVGLAVMISGSEEEFVKLMNQKAKDLGLKNTNFVNCTGLYDKNHYTTVNDMAVIFSQAIKNTTCREILTTQKYVSSDTKQHPGGLTLHSDLFKILKGDEPQNGVILGGKTGYVDQAGYCLATFGAGENGKEYICVTLNAPSKWPAVYDHVNIFSAYAK